MVDEKTYEKIVNKYNSLLTEYKAHPTTDNYLALQTVKTAIRNILAERYNKALGIVFKQNTGKNY